MKWILHRHLIDQKIPPLNLSSRKPLTGPHHLAGKFGSLDYYITKSRSEVNKLTFKQRPVKDNLTPEERAALLGPVYMEKSCPGQGGHPSSRVNFTERLYEKS